LVLSEIFCLCEVGRQEVGLLELGPPEVGPPEGGPLEAGPPEGIRIKLKGPPME
jgi:hypothetical protein